ncbi:MAG: prepilin peptidase, partial [Acidobacteriota bacterium]
EPVEWIFEEAAAGTSFFVMATFSLFLLILFFTDLDTMLLPNSVTRTGTALGLGLAPWNPLLGSATHPSGAVPSRIFSALAGAALGVLLVLGIMGAWRLWVRGRLGPHATKEEKTGMGWGDLKMLALIGAFVGLRQVFFVTFLAAVLGSLVGLSLILAGRGGRHMPLPFGTFLSLAGLTAVFIGRPVVEWYLSLLGFP